MFIAVDLKVIEGLAGSVARAAGCSEDKVLAGLVRLWHRCWADKTDIFTRQMLSGVFGAKGLDLVIESLVSFGFLDASEPLLWRAKGGDKYLRLRQSRIDGGKRTASLKKAALELGSSVGLKAALEPSTTPALTPNTEHRTPNTYKKEEEASSSKPIPIRPPIQNPEDKFASPESFWAWTQFKRGQVGFVAEKPPPNARLHAFWTEVHLEMDGDPKRLEAAFFKFAESKHWEKADPPLPFNAFMSKWRDYAPAKRRA